MQAGGSGYAFGIGGLVLSLEASKKAWLVTGLTSSQKFVLCCLAECHNDETGRCDPSGARIAEMTGLDKKTVFKCVDDLEKEGLITRSQRQGTSTFYTLNLTQKRANPKTGQPDKGLPQKRISTTPKNGSPPDPKTDHKSGKNQERIRNDYLLEASSEAPSQPAANEIFILMPTNKFNTVGEEYPVTETQLAEFQEIYPGINVSLTLGRIKSWCVNNPNRRKTYSGMPRFIDTWLAKEQNQAGATNHAPNTPNRGKTWAERRDDLTDAVTNYERATNF